ncbi:MAG TPA: chorismate synthase [Pyrinomonadaceae bacterium]|nr:chorismate synthase [Pyrinomonadaceae bacterium]
MFFKFTTAGESHGKALVAVIEGMPAGVAIDVERINFELFRRQQGYGRGGRQKIEKDTIQILSGVRHGKTLGSPVAFTIENRDFVHWEEVMSSEKLAQEPKNLRLVTRPRPGHADLAGGQKFQTRDLRDILERASARETAARVACGAFAKQLLENFRIEIKSHVIKLGSVPETPLPEKSFAEISAIDENSLLRCADKSVEARMIELIDKAKAEGDTLGGIFEIVANNVVAGLGSHTSWFEKLDGRIAQAFMSIQAVKAVEIGSGVENASLFGSKVHDEITFNENLFKRTTNRAGGLEGGITNGEELRARGYLKPISTLKKPLRSVDIDTKEESLAAFERSDVTAVPAAGIIGEAMLAMVLANSMREKFGGDSILEMKANFDNYRKTLENY